MLLNRLFSRRIFATAASSWESSAEYREVHLPRQRMLDLVGPADPFVRLIEQPALPGRAHLRHEAHDGHRDEQQSDDQEAAEKFGVDGGTNARHPTHQCAERRPAQDQRRDLLEFDFLSLR